MKKFKTFVPAFAFLFLAGCGLLEPVPVEQLEVVNQTENGFTVLSKTGAEDGWLEAAYLESNLHDLYSRYWGRDQVAVDLVVTVLDARGNAVANFKQSFNLSSWWENHDGAFIVSVLENRDYVFLAKKDQENERFTLSYPEPDESK